MAKLGVKPKPGPRSPSGAPRSPACSARPTTSRRWRRRGSRTSTPTSTSTCSARRTTSASSTTATAPTRRTPGPPGSAQIEGLFTGYFDGQGLATDPTAFDGRSDYGPFIAAGIPAGGLFSGAEGVKTAEQAAIYGGTAGVAYDTCYHQACDTVNNLNTKAINEMSDAVAHVWLTLAKSKTGLYEDDSRAKAAAVKARRAVRTKARAKGRFTVKVKPATTGPNAVR